MDDLIKLYKDFWRVVAYNVPRTKMPREHTPADAHSFTELERLVRLDGATIDEIYQVLEYLRGHDFWDVNIRSTKKLRYHFPRLLKESQKRRQAKDYKQQAVDNAIRQYEEWYNKRFERASR